MSPVEFPNLIRGRKSQNRVTMIVIIVLCLFVTSCSAIPLTTMVRMSTFNERDFAAINADTVRIRVKLPVGFTLDSTKCKFGVKVTSKAGASQGVFRLEEEGAYDVQLRTGLISHAVKGTAYTLRLSAFSREDFRKLQGFVKKAQVDSIEIDVAPMISSFPDGVKKADVWVDLLLTQNQGYFTLLDDAEIPVDEMRETAKN